MTQTVLQICSSVTEVQAADARLQPNAGLRPDAEQRAFPQKWNPPGNQWDMRGMAEWAEMTLRGMR